MKEAIWIHAPKPMVEGDINLARQQIPSEAGTFQLKGWDGTVHANGNFVLSAIGDEIAQRLFRSITFMLPELADPIKNGEMILHVGKKAYRQGACNTIAYLTETMLARFGLTNRYD